MSRRFVTNVDLNKNELQNARIQNLATAPGSPVEGQIYFNTADNQHYIFIDAAWVPCAIKDGVITTAKLANEAVTNAKVATTAGIALSKLATDPLARANHTGTQTAATISDFDTQVRTSRLDQMAAPTAAVSANGQKITTLADPTADGDAANKGYVDRSAQGFDTKEAARVATQGNVNLASPGGVIDGVTMAADDRVLVKAQTAGAENGIYVWNGSTVAMTRAPDADTAEEIENALVFVSEGTNADTLWALSTNPPITLGTTALAFTQIGTVATVSAGAGLTKTGDTIDVIAAAGSGIVVNADNVDIDPTNGLPVNRGGTGAITAAGAKTNLGFPTKHAESVGDAVATSFTVTHNFNTLDVQVSVFRNADGVEVEADVTRTGVNTVSVGFAAAPAANEYRVVVIG